MWLEVTVILVSISQITVDTGKSIDAVTIQVEDARDGKLVQSFEFCVSPGRYSGRDSFWATVEQSSNDIETLLVDIPSVWIRSDDGYLGVANSQEESTMFIRSPGYEIVPIAIPVPLNNTKVALRPVPKITGTVTGPDGKKIENSPIMIGALPPDFPQWDLGLVSSATTDAQGEFVLDSYPLQFPLLLTTHMKPYGPGYAHVKGLDDLDGIELRLCDAAKLNGGFKLSTGTVKDVHASIDLITANGIRYGSLFGDIIDKSMKSFSVDCLPPGAIRFLVFGTYTESLIFGGDFVQEVDLSLECGKSTELDFMVQTGGGK